MHKRKHYQYLLIAFLSLFVGITSSYANEQIQPPNVVVMEVKPQTCVSLHEGQECFVTITINWQADLINDYCLYTTKNQDPVICWEKVKQGTVEYELSTKENVRFMLAQTPKTRFMLTQKPYAFIAEAQLSVSWVYKKKQKSRLSWRLF